MQAGFDFGPDFAECDAVVIVDTPAPWLPARHHAPGDAPVIQIGADALSSDLPIRGFPADVVIASRPSSALPMLTEAIRRAPKFDRDRIDRRREVLNRAHETARAGLRAKLLPDSSDPHDSRLGQSLPGQGPTGRVPDFQRD